MPQARWNAIGAACGITRTPYWRIRLRHALADAARGYDWPLVLDILSTHRDLVNASRPGGAARYAPLHQAAHGGAPAPVVRRLIEMGAWRTLRTRQGERPLDIAHRRGHLALSDLLLPVYKRRRIPPHVLGRVQKHFHTLIRRYPAGRTPSLRLPVLEPLLELGRESVYFEVPGMFGGFTYYLADDGTVPKLMVERFSRVLDCSRFEITPRGWTPVDSSDVESPQRPPASCAPARSPAAVRRDPVRARSQGERRVPALAAIRLANGGTGYVELSPAGRHRLAGLEGEVLQLSNADVVERHRHPQGIRCMSLNRLMRLRAEERTRRPAGTVCRESEANGRPRDK